MAEHMLVLPLLPLAILLVFAVHEFGHYLAARLLNMNVTQVSVGIGRRLWEKTDKRGTRWVVHLLPFKAHVHIADYHPEKGEPLWRRLAVVLAGPVANFILPFFLFAAFFLTFGKPAMPTYVTGVEIGMPGYESGLRPGDKIIAIEGETVRSLSDILEHTRPKRSTPLNVGYARDGEKKTTQLMPRWMSYNEEGTQRERGLAGIMARQAPQKLEHIKSFNGEPVASEDEARALIIAHFGQRVTMGIRSRDREVHDYLVDLHESSNAHLRDASHKDYDSFCAGTLMDNIYLPFGTGGALAEAGAETVRLVGGIATLPLNLFPVDKELIAPDAIVSTRASLAGHVLFRIIFLASLLSVIIGWMNLIPFPGTDGGVILLNIAETINKAPLTRRAQAKMIGLTLFVLYFGAFAANAPDLHGYFEYKLEVLADDS